MIGMNTKNHLPLLIFVTTFLVCAFFVFLRELLSIRFSGDPGGYGPNEYESSGIRVFLFCGSAIISAFFVWFLTTRKHSEIFLPVIPLVIIIAVGITLISTLINYDTNLACNDMPVRLSGFPFGYLSCGRPLRQPCAIFNLFSYSAREYSINSWKLFPDILFWTNLVFLIPGWVSIHIQKSKTIPEEGE